jgi:tRNA(Arg) A34 adenosine deaminase TadA
MCMAACLWAGLDRVVYGATIDDAAKFYPQIYVYAKDLARRGDLACEVAGPVEREACFHLFTPAVTKANDTPWKLRRK